MLLVPGCSTSDPEQPQAAAVERDTPAPSATADDHGDAAEAPPPAPLRPGERFQTLAVPGGPYTPSAPSSGKDDYHCFLLDPHLSTDTFVTGSDVLPGNADVVHHAILFTRRPGAGGRCRDVRRADARPGLDLLRRHRAARTTTTTAVRALDSAPWLAAWAPGGGEAVFGKGTGKFVATGSRVDPAGALQPA